MIARGPSILLTGALAALALAVGPAGAASSKAAAFVADASQADTYEIHAARLMMTEGRDDRVKGFAQQMLEHMARPGRT